MFLKKNSPQQGEIWMFDPDPVKGTELGKKVRPALILSCNRLNEGASGLLIIVLLTSKDKQIISCEQIQSVTKERLIKNLEKLKIP